jgi:hypothetical protein
MPSISRQKKHSKNRADYAGQAAGTASGAPSTRFATHPAQALPYPPSEAPSGAVVITPADLSARAR